MTAVFSMERLCLMADDDASGRRVIAYPSLSLAKGQPVCLVGPNGSGKSALLAFLFGDKRYRTRCRPRIELDGVELDPQRLRLGEQGFRLIPQHRPSTGTLTCGELWRVLDAHRAASKDAFEGIWAPLKYSAAVPFAALSGGQWKLSLLYGYLQNHTTRGLFLDEILAGLSPDKQEGVLNVLTEVSERQGKVVLVTAVEDEVRPTLDRWLTAHKIIPVRLVSAASA